MQLLRIEKFQSTLSVRRATDTGLVFEYLLGISIHALRKESDHRGNEMLMDAKISIHALRKESDYFPPLYERLAIISIHALRKESDSAVRIIRTP